MHDSRSRLLEFTPELRLIAAHLRSHFQELDDQGAVEKILTRSTEVRNGIEHHRTDGVEHCLIVTALK